MIAVGTVVLSLPAARGAKGPIDFIDALFTATSAVCVTGLITVDTATAYSRFGQGTILVLIQFGGLGIMTFAVLAAELLRLRVSFSSQAAMRDMFVRQEARVSLRTALGRVLILTVLIETAGALILFTDLRAEEGMGATRWFEAVFLSVSAFCNAGFAVYTENLIDLRDSPIIVWTVMALVVLGGLGYPVLQEVTSRVWRRLRRQSCPVHWTLHTRIVLRVTAALTLGGALALWIIGLNDPELSFGGNIVNSLFQSVTARTAGFNTVDVSLLPLPALMILVPLMFVGGSPGSCAGGIKTTSATVWGARIQARLRGQSTVHLWGRRIPDELVRRAGLVCSVAVLWNAVGVMLLAISEGADVGVGLEHIVFEQMSAFGTVGLSAGLTPKLTVLGKLWIIATMFVGRVGPLTVAFAVMRQPRRLFDYPVEHVMIG
jgi:trk system potassium uptake protein TrkH